MNKVAILLNLSVASTLLCAQTATAPTSDERNGTPDVLPGYVRPNNSQMFHDYARRTFGVASLFEAGLRAGIDQARSAPSEWPEGSQGYAERFGSAAGGIVVRGTTEFGMAALFHEDLRRQPRGSRSAFTAALADTFTARKGDDGHTAFSFARSLGPAAGGLAESSWKPGGFERRSAMREIGLHYGFLFGRNLARELFRR